MSWKVVYTAGARRDLRGRYTYIAEELCAPEAAAGQAGRIMEGIRSLNEMPMRYRLYDDEPTAALDPVAEAEIYTKFNQIVVDKAAVFISHRLSSCRFCERIFVFDKG